jgi:hypothetical protein
VQFSDKQKHDILESYVEVEKKRFTPHMDDENKKEISEIVLENAKKRLAEKIETAYVTKFIDLYEYDDEDRVKEAISKKRNFIQFMIKEE